MNNLVLMERWQYDYKLYKDKVEKWGIATGMAYAIVLGQCSPALINRLEAHEDFTTINAGYDLVGLLELIHKCMYTGATTKDPEHALTEVL
jgi:hypothetical protein